jgi:carbonic anhydrase
MNHPNPFSPSTLLRDLSSGLIVFLVALPLCLGIALASGAPLFSGIVAGIIGGILVGSLSGSHTSVSGPAAGLTAIVAAQIAALGAFDAFLLAVVVAGVFQIFLGIIKAGSLSAFFPSSVIKGLLAAIGTLLIIKQLPYLLGHDMIPKATSTGHASILSEVGKIFTGEIHAGALAIGLISLAVLILWDKWERLKYALVPAPLVVVLLGVAMAFLFKTLGEPWVLTDEKRFLVNVPVSDTVGGFFGNLMSPDFSQWSNPAIYACGLTIAIVASLETLLNLDAVDKLDKKQRLSPPSRELWAQGVGNVACGLLGGLPVTSVIIRGSVNVNAGSQTKLSAVFHGVLLLVCVMLVPTSLNMIPLSCLAAILLMTGFKLASPKLFSDMWSEGRSQFLPFVITLVAIVATDLLIGIAIGLTVSLLFILASNLNRPIRQIIEKHVGGEIRHIELANQVSFLNKAALEKTMREAPSGSHLLLDARRTDYIDPDVLSLIREFKDVTGPAHQVKVSLRGFRDKYHLEDNIQFVDYTTRELQSQLTPSRVLQILREGNDRFRSGHRLDRDLRIGGIDDSPKEHPMAVIFSGIDPRTPSELIFDLGLGDIFSIRMAGNAIGPNVIGSMEYGCVVGGAKLILVMGHTQSGLVQYAMDQACVVPNGKDLSCCPSLRPILDQIRQSITDSDFRELPHASPERRSEIIDAASRRNVSRCVRQVVQQSPAIGRLVEEHQVAVVGALFDVSTGRIEFLLGDSVGLVPESELNLA